MQSSSGWDRGMPAVRIAAAFGPQKLTKIAEAILQRSSKTMTPSCEFANETIRNAMKMKISQNKIDQISKNFLIESIKADALALMKR